jgi:hypothetical protein
MIIRRYARLVLVCVAMAALPVSVHAQAWTPPKGDFSLLFTLQRSQVDKHLLSRPYIGEFEFGTREVDFGAISSRSLGVGASYSFTDRLTLDGDVAWVNARYEGDGPESAIDDGDWNADFQDVRLGLRYSIEKGPWAVTPLVGIVVPTHDYETVGHSAVGRNLKELQLGAAFGRLLGRRYGPRAYFDGFYAYSLVEEIGNLNLDRSNASLEFGYFVKHFLTLRVFGAWQHAHGGIDWSTDIHDDDDFHIHDQGAAASFYRAGVGVAIPTGSKTDIFLSYFTTLTGENTHDLTGFTITTGWRLARPTARIRAPKSGSADDG